MAGESISIPILTPGADAAARNIKQVGDAAAGTSAKLDFAAASLKAFNDAAAKSAKADQALTQARNADTKANKLLIDSYNVLTGRQTEFTKLQADTGRQLDNTAKKAATAAGGFTALAGGGGLAGGGMGAAVGAGAALFPIIATVATGVGGLAIAALAASKNTSALGGILGPLKGTFSTFQKDLQPTVLKDFAFAAQLAGNVLHDIEPVTKATGQALAGVFAQVDTTFQSGTWQQFFKFMASTASQDIALLGKNFTDLLRALPPLVQQLQPVSQSLLTITDTVFKLTGHLTAYTQGISQTSQHESFLAKTTDLLRTALFAPGAGLLAALKLLHLTGVPAARTLSLVGQAANTTGRQVYTLTTAGDHLGKASVTVILAQEKVAQSFLATYRQAQNTAAGIRDLTNQFTAGLDPLKAYTDALLTQHTDARSLEQALDASGNAIGYQTAKQRASFQIAQTYIGDLESTAQQALASHQGIDRQIASLQNSLPILERVKGGTREYWQEVRTLVGYLNQLRRERAINELIRVSGTGTWSISPSRQLPGGTAGGPFPQATGGLIPGSGNRDTFPALLTPGEAVVPKHLTPAVAPFLRANKVPGFAAGGIAGSYHGPVAGLPPWTGHDLNVTVGLFERAVAKATLAGIRSAVSSAGSFAGPGGGAPAANAALARRMFPQWGSGPLWAAWNYVAMRESGWNQFARNPSSGAYGIPQALPPTKMPFAAQAAGGSNPAAQIGWMAQYMSQRYGGPIGAAQHEAAFGNYDRGGWLRPGLTLAYNATGRPELVIPSRGGGHVTVLEINAAGGGELDQMFASWLRKYIRVRGGNVQLVLGRK